MSTIYQCLKRDTRYIPPVLRVVHEAQTEMDAIAWLEHNGGGLVRVVHRVALFVRPKPTIQP